MMVVKIEIWPGGDESKKYEHGSIFVTNVARAGSIADYDVKIMKSPKIAKTPGVWKRGKVFSFNRAQLGPQDLLLRALIACIGNRSSAAVKSVQGEGPHLEEGSSP